MAQSWSIIRVLSTCSEDSGFISIGEDSVPRPLVHRPALKKIVGKFRKMVKTFDLKNDPSLQLSGQNFFMAWIGPKGARLSFPDNSVVMDIPPGALTHPQVVYCCRIDDLDARSSSASADVVFYSTILTLGATDRKFNRKIHIKFRHFAKFDNDEQKSALAAFTQCKIGGKFQKEPEFDMDVDDEFIILKVDHFCNLGAGIDTNDVRPRPSKRMALISFLVSAEYSKDVAATLNLLVADDDHSHLKVLKDLVATRWYSVGSNQNVRISEKVLPFTCNVQSVLHFKFTSKHFQVERSEKVVQLRTIPIHFHIENNLKRDSAAGFEEEAPLCHVQINEVTENTTTPIDLLNLDILWSDHNYVETVVQAGEIVMQQREEHAARDEQAIAGRPREVSELYKLADDNHLDVTELQPSQQPPSE